MALVDDRTALVDLIRISVVVLSSTELVDLIRNALLIMTGLQRELSEEWTSGCDYCTC
jgi:hypothetical protein